MLILLHLGEFFIYHEYMKNKYKTYIMSFSYRYVNSYINGKITNRIPTYACILVHVHSLTVSAKLYVHEIHHQNDDFKILKIRLALTST